MILFYTTSSSDLFSVFILAFYTGKALYCIKIFTVIFWINNYLIVKNRMKQARFLELLAGRKDSTKPNLIKTSIWIKQINRTKVLKANEEREAITLHWWGAPCTTIHNILYFPFFTVSGICSGFMLTRKPLLTSAVWFFFLCTVWKIPYKEISSKLSWVSLKYPGDFSWLAHQLC